jgi:hypothetical protein
MPVKAFWDALEKRLAACSPDELRAILRAVAQAAPPAQRRAFLEQLKPVKHPPASLQKNLRQDELLDDIDDLNQDIQEAAGDGDNWDDDAEDGDAYDEWGGDYGGYYDDEDSLGPSHVFVEPLTAQFARAQTVFERGNLALARDAYQKLFEEALLVEDEYGRGVRPEDLTSVDLRESRTRYLRAVYETASPASRSYAAGPRVDLGPALYAHRRHRNLTSTAA